MDLKTIQTLLDLLNPLHGDLDKQIYNEKMRLDFDATPDTEYAVNITSKQESDFTKAILILENQKKILS